MVDTKCFTSASENQLKELEILHSYVGRFVGYRLTVMAGTTTLLGLSGGLAVYAKFPVTAFAIIGLNVVVAFGTLMSAAISKAIWITCIYACIIEKRLAYVGAMHHWLAINSYPSKYSTNYASYIGLLMMSIAICILSIAITFSRDDDNPISIAFTSIIAIAAFAWNLRLVLAKLRPDRIVMEALKDGGAITSALLPADELRWIELPISTATRVPPEMIAFLRSSAAHYDMRMDPAEQRERAGSSPDVSHNRST